MGSGESSERAQAAVAEAAPVERQRLRTALETMRAWAKTPQGQVWLDAAWIWALTRIIFVLLTALVPSLLTYARTSSVHSIFDQWVTQDAYQFAQIAAHGYVPLWRTAYWPLFPFLEHMLGPIFGGDYGLAGIVIANASFFGVLVVLRGLAERELDAPAARRTALYLAIFPTAFYFFAPYSESLFLLASVGVLAALQQRVWWLAGVLGAAATLLRSMGLLLLLPFAVELLQALWLQKARWWLGGWALLMPATVGIFSGYLTLQHRDPLAFVHAEGYWGRSLQAPWTTLAFSVGELRHLSGQDVIASTHLILNLGAVLVFLALAMVTLRTLPLSYGAYTLVVVLYFLLFPVASPIYVLQGDGRYVLMLFPAFMVLGRWGHHAWLHEALLVVMLPLLAVLSAHFLLHLASG